MVVGLGASPTTDICLTLYGPTGTLVAGPACTAYGFGGFSTGINQKFTTAGGYTIDATETAGEVQRYALSLERLNPPPPDAIPLVLKKTQRMRSTRRRPRTHTPSTDVRLVHSR
jgi:hypothetical protein